ncbi:MAG TPA: TOPRIM nucleotidyl transferase/hydrolase domain-containing protein [Solirubrobacteraceae bacterium]|nr:TOPRIM nucleotidyl transferase/hydrolase domain-containing protein [Solirubrobacteraceae bacterium]
MAEGSFGVREVQIRGFRSARSVRFAPGPVFALVGGPSVGKSNVLAAVWTLLQRGTPAPQPADLSAGVAERIELSATLGDGDEVSLEVSPPGSATGSGRAVPVLFLPASLRSGGLVAGPTLAPQAARVAREYLTVGDGASSAAPAAALVRALDELCAAGVHGLVLLLEEPELFLRPQAQRYLYRLLRRFAAHGNQVLYSTHEPAFLNVGRLDEVALVEHSPRTGTRVIQPEQLGADESFRALSEIDAERGELFLARAVLLVEGRTEKLTFPFVFNALGHDVDREAITIVDCGGKPNMRLFIRICHAAKVPCVAVHDRDAPPGRRPSQAQRVVNEEIAQLAGPHHTVVLAPDFEAAAGLRGHRHKPTHAWQRFSRVQADAVPAPLRDAVEKVLALARA